VLPMSDRGGQNRGPAAMGDGGEGAYKWSTLALI
jgi:hypothetical protein